MPESRYQRQRPPIDFRNPTDLKQFIAGAACGIFVLALLAWTIGFLA